MSRNRKHLKLENRQEILEGPVISLLLKMGWPGALSLFAQSAFNLIDRVFVARLGEVELGSLGLAFVVQSLVIAIAGGLGSGLRSHTSISAGADKRRAIQDGASQVVYLILMAGLVLSVAGPFLAYALYSVMGVSRVMMSSVMTYTSIILYGSFFHLISMSGNSLLRGIGEMKAPMKYMLTGIGINFVLDPLFIFGWGFFPAMGIRGAALATVTGRGISCVLLVRHLVIKGVLSKETLFPMRFSLPVLKRIMRVGLPSMFTRSLNALGMGLVFALVTPFGVGAAAAYTAGITFQRLILIPANGLSGAAVTMMGQNGGAGQPGRVKEVYFKTQMMTFAIIGGLSLILVLAADPLSSLLLKEASSRAIMVQMLYFLAPGYFFMASRIITVGGLNVLGFSIQGMIVSLSQKFILTFPLAWVLSLYFDLKGIWFGLSFGHCLAAALGCFIFTNSINKREIRV